MALIESNKTPIFAAADTSQFIRDLQIAEKYQIQPTAISKHKFLIKRSHSFATIIVYHSNIKKSFHIYFFCSFEYSIHIFPRQKNVTQSKDVRHCRRQLGKLKLFFIILKAFYIIIIPLVGQFVSSIFVISICH